MLPKPKKALGQNFLIDPNIRRKIVSACGLDPSQTVLEIGAGKGEMTGLLARQAKKVYALEIDSNLLEYLKDAVKDERNVTLIHKDILKFDIADYFRGLAKEIAVFGNIPYYISTPILEQLIKHRKKVSRAFLTVQKEFAERVAAKPGTKKYGSLSCFVQYYLKPRILFTISKSCFFPKPKVDSAFLYLQRREHTALDKTGEAMLFQIIRKAFNQRRKTLHNSLKTLIAKDKLTDWLLTRGLAPDIRPEKLSLEDFCSLAASYK